MPQRRSASASPRCAPSLAAPPAAAARAAAGADRGDRGGLGALPRRSAARRRSSTGYEASRDLNGDGRADFVTDLAGLECAGAWDALLHGRAAARSASGCREPGGGHDRFDLGPLRGFSIEEGEAGALPARRRALRRGRLRAGRQRGLHPHLALQLERARDPARSTRRRAPTPAAPSRRRRRRCRPRRLDAPPGAGREPGGARRRRRRHRLARRLLPRGAALPGADLPRAPAAERGVALDFAFSQGALEVTRRLRGDRRRRLRRGARPTARSPPGSPAATARSRSSVDGEPPRASSRSPARPRRSAARSPDAAGSPRAMIGSASGPGRRIGMESRSAPPFRPRFHGLRHRALPPARRDRHARPRRAPGARASASGAEGGAPGSRPEVARRSTPSSSSCSTPRRPRRCSSATPGWRRSPPGAVVLACATVAPAFARAMAARARRGGRPLSRRADLGRRRKAASGRLSVMASGSPAGLRRRPPGPRRHGRDGLRARARARRRIGDEGRQPAPRRGAHRRHGRGA